MKWITLIFFITFTMLLTSCSLENDSIEFDFERVPIERVDIPEQFIHGTEIDITVSYSRPSDCHTFHALDYTKFLNEYTITVINIVTDDDVTCKQADQSKVISKTLNFLPSEKEEVYIFKFWQGVDENNKDVYLIIEVPVVEKASSHI